MRVLVVEDSVDIAAVFRLGLEMEGMEVIAHTEGFEGLLADPSAFAGYDAVVCDFSLGGTVTGCQICHKALSSGVSRVLIVTAASPERAVCPGIDILHKPISISDLRDKLLS